MFISFELQLVKDNKQFLSLSLSLLELLTVELFLS